MQLNASLHKYSNGIGITMCPGIVTGSLLPCTLTDYWSVLKKFFFPALLGNYLTGTFMYFKEEIFFCNANRPTNDNHVFVAAEYL